MSDTPDEFADTFADITADKPVAAAPAPAAAEPVPAPEPVAPLPVVPPDPAQVTVASAEPTDAPAETPAQAEAAPVEPAPAVTPAPAKPEISDEELLKRFAGLVRNPPPQQEQPAPQAPLPTPPPLYTEDEQKFLASYEKDWPDVARAEALRRRADLQSVVGYVFQEIAKEFGPVVQSSRMTAQQMQMMELRSHVPDYDKIYEPIVNWVGSQPPIIRQHLENIVNRGSPQDVLSLIDTWRSSQGSQPAPAPVIPAKPALSAAAQKAVAALAPVSAKRSNVTPSLPESFDDAWALANAS